MTAAAQNLGPEANPEPHVNEDALFPIEIILHDALCAIFAKRRRRTVMFDHDMHIIAAQGVADAKRTSTALGHRRASPRGIASNRIPIRSTRPKLLTATGTLCRIGREGDPAL